MMGRLRAGRLAVAVLSLTLPAAAEGRTRCTIVADAEGGKMLLEQGDCRTRVTPASTFKLALAVMGFDAGFLTGPHAPVLSFREGDPDWGGEAWKQPTDPARWLKYSVVWYSQRIMHALGAVRVTRYATDFGYGNADLSGDPGKDNGLDRAWIASSLKISPAEQVAFLVKLVDKTLPVAPHVYDEVDRTVETTPAGEWMVLGKTGAAFPRRSDGSFDEERGDGWFVGWAVRGHRTLVFARLVKDEGGHEAATPGVRARDAFLADLQGIAAALPGPERLNEPAAAGLP